MAGGFFLFFILIIVIGILSRTAAGGFDRDRVRRYIQEQGGELLDSHWQPFGKGWYGEKDSRIYRVRYRDSFGNIREATVKTSMMSGVYFTDDVVVMPATGTSSEDEHDNWQQEPVPASHLNEIEKLKQENARLRRELEQAKQPQPLFGSSLGAADDKRQDS